MAISQGQPRKHTPEVVASSAPLALRAMTRTKDTGPRRTPFDCAIVGPQPSGRRDHMTAFIGRREFITLVGGAAATWPRAAGAQERTSKISRVGFLLNVPSELHATIRPRGRT